MKTLFLLSCLLLTAAENLCGGETAQIVADSAPTYRVILSRPDQAGEKFKLSASCQRVVSHCIVRGNNKPEEKKVDLTTSFEAEIKIRSVNEKGRADAMEVTVLKMESKDATIPVPMKILAEGTVISARYVNGETRFSAGGSPMTEVQSAEIGLFISLNPNEEKSIFGSETPRIIGESWSLRPDACAQLLGSVGSIDPKGVRAESKLISAQTVNGVPSIQITTNLVANRIKPPAGTPSFESCQALFSAALSLPEDPAVRGIRSDGALMRISMRYRFREADGSSATASQVSEMRSKSVMTPF